ncbi:two-component regulator propeller domain-containing protein [Bacteroides neonati]|uniref:two-component regulator propeller domain-containing protein n=1 Tax=Bacteroides neonati TaxID=1347393 RepID=UPI0004B76D36|nr:two-component regulator propeller domain-containing protein [Bacteroides neonati]
MKNTLFLFMLFSCLGHNLLAQGLLFNHLRVEDGLSQATVYSTYQDELNRIWIATRDGLNLYDGNKIEVFRPSVGDSVGLLGSNMQYVCGDQKGHVYIWCMAGLVMYDLKTLQMKPILKKGVDCITYGTDRLWVIENQDIKYLDPKTLTLKTYLKLGYNDIGCIKEAPDGKLYIGTTSNGVYIIDQHKKKSNLLPGVHVVCLYIDKYTNCWIGTLRDGLFKIDTKQQITHFKNDPNNPKSLSDNYVRAVCLDNLGDYWIGTFKGVDRLNSRTGEFSNFDHTIDDPYSIGNSSVWSITNDRQGTLWIGTFFGGVDILNPAYSFKQYYRVKGDKNGLSGSVIGNIAEDRENNLWICTENGGLNYFDRKKNKFTSYTHDPKKSGSISSNNIKSIYLDEKNKALWLGTHMGGLNRYDLSTRRFERIKIGDNPLNNDYVRCIVPYQDDLYLGTHNSIVKYNRKTKKWASLSPTNIDKLQNQQIWDMFIDSKDQLWFSTVSSMYRYDLKKEQLTRYIYNPSNPRSIGYCFSNTFFEDKQGRLWIGSSGNGLSLYHPKTDDFTHYHTQNSQLIDDYILDINQAASGCLLIATNKGISKFDTQNLFFTNYNNKNYFPFASLNESSLFITRKNEIIVCSVNGLVILNEKDLEIKPQKYDINLTNLYVNNTLVVPSSEAILKQALPFTKEITLNHSHSVFSVEFALTNYIRSIQPTVYYKLEGFDKEWVKANARNLITYTNLTAGNYTLHIRTSNNDSSSETIATTQLNIIILPPIYLRWYAYLFYFITFASIFYTLLANYISKLQLKASLAYATREQKRMEELSQIKLNFFTNVSHEFRTPITLIISQLESMLQIDSIQQSVHNRLVHILKNAEKMKMLINELLDFRKQEQGYMKLKIHEQNIIVFLNAIVGMFQEYSQSKHIRFSFIHTEEDIRVWFDLSQMEKVFYNLLSNAFKFTPEKGEISISVEHIEDTVVIKIKDSGIGISQENIEQIFNPFFQVEGTISTSSINQGTGIGLSLSKGIVEEHKGTISVQSELGAGSTFKVTLMLGRTHFDKNKIITCEQEASELQLNLSTIEHHFITEIKEVQNETATSQKVSILIVEDNKELLQVLVEMFTPIYTIHTATNGLEGYEKAIHLQPDIVLTDVMMPQMTGTEMCRKIKNNVKTCHIPVVLLTARSTIEHTIEGLQTGADDYISKPFNNKILIIRCNNLINSRRLLQSQFFKSAEVQPQTLAGNAYDQELLEKAIAIIEKNISNEQFNIDMFAQEMCLGRTNLFSKIKGLTGQTPNDFITGIRLKKSLSLIIEKPQMPINTIATTLGFNDPPYFIKRFKKMYGITPLQYRKTQLNTPSEDI